MRPLERADGDADEEGAGCVDRERTPRERRARLALNPQAKGIAGTTAERRPRGHEENDHAASEGNPGFSPIP